MSGDEIVMLIVSAIIALVSWGAWPRQAGITATDEFRAAAMSA